MNILVRAETVTLERLNLNEMGGSQDSRVRDMNCVAVQGGCQEMRHGPSALVG